MHARHVLDLQSDRPATGPLRVEPSEATVALPPLLIVDGDEKALKLIHDALDELRLVNPIVRAGDGRTATAWLGPQLDAGPAPALVVSEAHLPDCHGLDLLRWMRRHRNGHNTHLVLLCESAELDDIILAHREGVTSYLVKPVGFRALVGVVRDIAAPWALLAGNVAP